MPFLDKAALITTVLLLAAGCSNVRTSDTAGNGDKVKLPRDYDNALVLMQSGDHQAAIPVLKAFIADHPELAGPQLNLGIAYHLTGQDEAATDALNQALQLNPENPAIWHQLAIMYRNHGDFDAALDAYKKALELNHDYALAHRNIGILYDIYLQQPEPALVHYRKYLDLSEQEDATVNRWILDLERRSANAQARMAP